MTLPASLAVSKEGLEAWGERFGREARAPLVVAISGDLGTGKTTLIQAICRGAGVREAVTSPTYALVHQYVAPPFPVYHLDLYRLDRPEELTNIGWDEIVTSRALVLVEWPQRAGDRLPPGTKTIALEYDPREASRRILHP